MPSALESKAALSLVTAAAVRDVRRLYFGLTGSSVARRANLLEGVSELIAYYSDGSSALAADFYEDERELAPVRQLFSAEPVVQDRAEKIRRAIAWALEPLFEEINASADARLAEVTQLEVARPYRDTIVTNTRRDPAAVGWKRITGECCRFCRMLGDRGAVYRESTALFAAHTNCDCTAAPVFRGGRIGPEASVIQYLGSKRNKSAAQRARIRDYLDATYGPE